MLNHKCHQKAFLLSSVYLLVSLLYCCHGHQIRPTTNFSDKRHIGHWKGFDPVGRRGELILYENGFAFFTAAGRSFGGPKLTQEGALLYQIDYSKNPIHLDLIGTNEDYNELKRIKMILVFPRKNKMRVCTFMDENRPLNFHVPKLCHVILLSK